jgi:hypothetical protein
VKVAAVQVSPVFLKKKDTTKKFGDLIVRAANKE